MLLRLISYYLTKLYGRIILNYTGDNPVSLEND